MKTLHNCTYSFMLFFVSICFHYQVNCQNDSISGTELIDYYISKDKFTQADSTLKSQIAALKKSKTIDSLYKYPYYVGKVALLRNSPTQAILKAKKFIDNLKVMTTSNRTMFRAYLSINSFYYDLNETDKGIASAKKALEYAISTPDVKKNELGNIYYNIGGDYHSKYDMANALVYFKKSANAFETSINPNMEKISDAYSGIGVGMWGLNKLDSAKVYFDKAIKTLDASDLEGYYKLYSIGFIKFNLALVLDDSGNLNEAIKTKKEIIKSFNEIIKNSEDEKLIKDSKRLSALSLSNLAAFYNDIGLVTKALNMLKYAHEKKKLVYDSQSPRLVTSLMQIATAEIELQDLDKGINTIKETLKKLRNLPSEYPSIEAELLQLLGSAYAEKEDVLNSNIAYEKSDSLFNKIYPQDYGKSYLIMLRDYALFLSKSGQHEKAISIANKPYDYILKNGGNDNFPLIKQITTLSDVYFEAGDYKKSKKWAVQGDLYLDKKIKAAASKIDSLKIEFTKPKIILLAAKSKYYSTPKKNKNFLLQLTSELNKAISILEKRKTIIYKTEDISAIISESKDVSEFSKQIYLELYELTKNPEYLDKIIEFHEANIYNKIRLRLNLKHDANFVDIPKSIFKREKSLKESLSNILTNNNTQIDNYFKIEKSWFRFLDSLKINYPEYYQMRYEKIRTNLEDLQSKLSKQTTVIRYFNINKTLFAFVVSTQDKHLFKLENKNLKTLINQLNNDKIQSEEINTKLHKLYTLLWKPLENKISTKNVVIIPDGELFNLSFETLTPAKIKSFKDLKTNSLLAKYSISYNYSLLLLDKNRKTLNYAKDFVAFAPEFNDKMKSEYKIKFTDSVSYDKTYMTLLPQPFTVDLVDQYTQVFNGHSFTNEKASKQVFTREAKEHKIIHIGTHAESNNISPELSRLIFAKSVKNDSISDDNSLYAYEIYNQNLSSNLAILTACETGKPTYQSGEGMISLAHAFNYAGSESILTSLWKIDEQSSAKIIKNFYDYLEEGLPKDEALQQAKLDYLATAEGRTLSPQYWAGLVLIGDTMSIDLNTSSSLVFWLLGIIILIILGAYVKRKRQVKL